MLTWLRRLFSAPLFDDSNQTRLARLTAITLLITALASAMAAPLVAMLSAPARRPAILGAGAALLLGLAVIYLMLRRAWTNYAALVLPALLLACLTFVMPHLGGLQSAAMTGYMVIIVVAGILLGRAGAVLYAVLGALAVGGLWYGETTGILLAAQDYSPARAVILHIAVLGVGGALLYLAARHVQVGVDAAHDLDEHLLAARKRAQQMELLAAVARHLTGLYDLRQLMDETVRRLHEDFGYEHVSLLLVEGSQLIPRAVCGKFSDLPEVMAPIPLGRGIIGRVGQSGQAYLANDTRTDDRFVPLPGAEVGSELAAPLRLGKSVIGVLNVAYGRPGAFDETDVRTLQSLADLLATALQSGRLLDELRARERLADALRRVGQAVSASLELQVVLETIGAEACAVFDVSAATIWLVEGEEMCVAAARGFDAEPVMGARFRISDPVLVAARAVREHRPVIINSIQTSPEGAPRLKELISAQAVLATPIIREGEPLAALVVIDTIRPERFTAQDAAAVELLGAQLATAVYNARLFSEAQRRAQQLALVNSLAHDMTGLIEMSELCERVAAKLHAELGYYSVAIFTVDEPGRAAVMEAVAGAHSELASAGEYRQAFGQGVIGTAAATGQPIVANDVHSHPAYYQLEGMRVQAEAVLPLKASDRTVGVLVVASDQAGAFAADDLVTLTTISDQLAVAMDKARYLAETRQRAQELSGLYDTALATSGVLERGILLRRLSDHVHSLLTPDAVGVALFDAETNEVELALAVESGRLLEDRIGMRVPVDEGGLTGWVIRNRLPLFVEDLENDALPAKPIRLSRSTRSWMGTPLIAHETVIGALFVQAFRPRAFDERDRSMVLSLAGQIAIALDNARLYQSVQQQAAELGALYRASAALFNTGEGLTAVAAKIAQTLTEEFDFAHCDVRLVDEGGQGLTLAAQVGSFEVNCPPLRVDGDGIVAEAARTRRAVYYADVSSAPSYLEGHSLTKSELAVPLLAGDTLIGVLNLESPEPDSFPERSRRVVSAFAERAALALENMRLMEAQTRRARQLSLLYDVSRQVAGTLDAQAITHRAAEALVNQFGYVQAAVMMPVGDGEMELVETVATEEMGVDVGFRQPITEGIIGRAALTRASYLAEDIGSDPYYFNPIGRKRGSALAIPMLRDDSLLGVLYIETNQPNAFSPEDTRALETVASHIATALVNAQLYGQVTNRLREMTGLQSLSQAVASSLNLNEIFDTVVLLLHDIFGYHYVSLAVLDEGFLRLVAQVGFRDARVFPDMPVSKGIAGRAARTSQPQYVRDVTSDPDYMAGAEDAESEIAVPLVKDQQVLGVLDVSSTAERPLAEVDVNLLITLAGQIAVAIENARLFQAEREQRELAEVLRTAGIALSTTLNYDTLLDLLLDQIRRRVPYDSAAVLDVENGVVTPARLRGYEKYGEHTVAVSRATSFHVSEYANLRRVVETRQPVIVDDAAQDPDWRLVEGLGHVRSWAGAPVIIQDEVFAILALESQQPNVYQASHAEWLTAFAGHAALALQNARLFEAAEQRAAELEALRQASLSLTSSLDPYEVLGAILDGAFRLLPDLGNAHIFLFRDGRLIFGAAKWGDARQQEPWSEPRPEGITYTVARSGQTIVVPDMSRHPLFGETSPGWHGAIVGLPLKIGTRIVGVMNVSYLEPRDISDSELRLLRLLGDQAAVAIENGRLFQSEREQRSLAEALRDAAHALNSTLDLTSILDRLLEELAQIIPHDSSAVMMIEGDNYRAVGGRNLPGAGAVSGTLQPLTNLLARELNETRRPIVLEDAQADPRFERWDSTDYVRGWIGVPLLSRDKVIGALTVDSRKVGAYTEREAEVAFAFASQAAIAIENARLYEGIQARAEMLAVLNATALDISIPHDLPELLHTIVERAARLLLAPGGGLYLCEAERTEVRCVVSHNMQHDDTGQVFQFGEGPAGQVALSGEALLIEAQAAAPVEADDAPPAAAPPPASISVPMNWLGRVIGVIYVEDTRGQRSFGATDLETLTLFARQAAIAVENARLLAETQRRAEEQRLLFDASRDFTAGLDESGVLEAVARHMVAALKVYDCAVSRWDRENDQLITLLDYDETAEPDPTPPGTPYELVEYPATRQVLLTRQPLIVRVDDPDAPEAERIMLEEYGHGTDLLVPLAAGEKVFGLVELFRPIGAAAFSADEIELAQSLSAQAAAALDNASLHTAMSERARELDSLVTANTALLSTLDLDLLLSNVLQAALDAIPPAEKGAILLVDPESGALTMRAVIGYSDPRVYKVRFAGQLGYSAQAMREQKAQLVRDAWSDSATRYTGDIKEMRDIRSAVAVPLLVNDQPGGVLSLDSTRPGAFGEADLRLLTAFATTAAAAIDNAQLHAEVQTLAITDSLTGLTNRRAFDRALETELSRAIRYDYPLTLIILDIDNFKAYNDTYGHPAGDRRLIAIAGLLRANVRDPDMAARYGGEEFALILPHTDKPGAMALAERIRATAETAAARRSGVRSPIAGFTVSLGVATYPEDAGTAEELLQAADRAELEAKRGGKNQVRPAPEMRGLR